MRKLLLLSLACSVIALTGCSASKYSQVVTEPVTTVMQEQHSQAGVAFIRTTSFGAAISAPIACYKEELNDYRFLGVLNAYESALAMLEPGKYIFVVGGESQSAVKGELDAGKLYSLRVSPRLGFWKARFKLTKVDVDSDLAKELKTLRRVTPNELGLKSMAPKMEKKVNVIKREGAPTEFTLEAKDGLPFDEFKVLFDQAPAK